MRPNEPSVEELKKMYRELMATESTDDNMKKISALESQIKRREAEGTLEKIEAKPFE